MQDDDNNANPVIPDCTGVPPRVRKQFLLVTLVWAISFVGATAALRFIPQLSIAVKLMVALVPVAFAALAVRGYLTYLHQADELTRKIQLEALAIAFGSGLGVATLYPLFERLGAPEAGLTELSMVLIFSWVLANIWGQRRYK